MCIIKNVSTTTMCLYKFVHMKESLKIWIKLNKFVENLPPKGVRRPKVFCKKNFGQKVDFFVQNTWMYSEFVS